MKSKIAVALVVILIGIQFIPGKDRTAPAVESGADMLQVLNADAEIASMIKDACYDCHSHNTEYPWYASIQPVGWWLDGHIEHGREELNFSTWASMDDDQKHGLKESAEKVEKRKCR